MITADAGCKRFRHIRKPCTRKGYAASVTQQSCERLRKTGRALPDRLVPMGRAPKTGLPVLGQGATVAVAVAVAESRK